VKNLKVREVTGMGEAKAGPVSLGVLMCTYGMALAILTSPKVCSRWRPRRADSISLVKAAGDGGPSSTAGRERTHPNSTFFVLPRLSIDR
jgi:hypothetical protein